MAEVTTPVCFPFASRSEHACGTEAHWSVDSGWDFKHSGASGRSSNQPVLNWPMKAEYAVKILDSLFGRHDDNGKNMWYILFIAMLSFKEFGP